MIHLREIIGQGKNVKRQWKRKRERDIESVRDRGGEGFTMT
jgi:hypothetical protein